MRPEPRLVDSHAHICDAVFDTDRRDIVERAQQAGIGAIVAVAEHLEDARSNIAMAEDFDLIRPAAGLYPANLDDQDLQAMVAFVRRHRERLWAIGEVGLDFWIAKTEPERNRQRDMFQSFIQLSLELDLPLNVHSRAAGRHAVGMLLAEGAKRVQLHAFDGKFSTARPALEAGYFFSIPPSIVRSRQKQKLVSHLPLDCLLLETDSPVLGPDPQQRNEPAQLQTALKAIADIKHKRPETIAAAVIENTHRLYGPII